MELRPEDRLILSNVKIQPSPEELEEINVLILLIRDWDYLISTIIDRGIGPLLFKKLSLLTNSSQIPEFVKTKLQQVYYKTFSRSTILYEHFRKIAEVFTSQNIPLIALKGIYLSEWLYKDIGLRQFSDIDLLVNVEDGDKCIGILNLMGYKSTSGSYLSKFVMDQFDKIHYPPMILNGVSVELHIKLNRKAEKYNLIIPTIWSNSIKTTINGVQIYALNINDLLIHLCLHLDIHFRGGKIQFTCFNDITNLIEKYKDTLNWSSIVETCRFYNCEEIVFEYIIMVHKYMKANVPNEILQEYSTLLTDEDEKFFFQFLKGKIGINSTKSLSAHFVNLKETKEISNKIKYLCEVVFPSKAFMIDKYKIKCPKMLFFYYPYRYYIGLMGVVNYLKKKVVGRK